MGFVLPTTGVTADGVEYTKAWVLNWQKVADASWFAIPTLMPVKPVFDLRAILPVLIMFVVTAVETVGDISGVMEGGLGREATDTELSGGVMCKHDKDCKPFCIVNRCYFPDSLRTLSKAWCNRFNYAAVSFRRRSSYDVLLNCN